MAELREESRETGSGGGSAYESLSPFHQRLVQRLTERNLLIEVAEAEDPWLMAKTAQNVTLNQSVQASAKEGDFILLYFPTGISDAFLESQAKLAQTEAQSLDRGQQGEFRYIVMASVEKQTVMKQALPGPGVDLENRVELYSPIGLNLILDDPDLQAWPAARDGFNDLSLIGGPVPVDYAKPLWSLILNDNPEVAKRLDFLLGGGGLDAGMDTEAQREPVAYERVGKDLREVFSAANGLRLSLDLEEMRIEHLLFALYDRDQGPVREALAAADIDRQAVLDRLKESTGFYLPEQGFEPKDEGKLPPLAPIVLDALDRANALADARNEDQIAPLDIWHSLNSMKDLIEDPSIRSLVPEVALPPIRKEEFVVRGKAQRDTWTREDLLDYQFYARAIIEPIFKGVTQPPVTIAIQAPWGQGKTSLMRMIQAGLDQGLEEKEKRDAMLEPVPSAKATYGRLYNWVTKPQLLSGKPVQLEEIAEESRPFHMREDGTPKRTGILHSSEGIWPFVPTVWFNPLYYQDKEQVWAGLAHAILHQLSNRINSQVEREKFWLELQLSRINKHAIRRDLQRAMLGRIFPYLFVYAGLGVALASLLSVNHLSSASVAGGSSAGVGAALLQFALKWNYKRTQGLDDKFEKYISEPNYEDRLGFLHFVDTDLDRALKLLVGDYPIAVFIDDLDRCDPDIVRKIILAINQFLSLPRRNVIFFLGMDMEMVAQAIEESYAQSSNEQGGAARAGESFGWRFMNKFVQLPFFIPRMDKPTATEFLGKMLSVNGSSKKEVKGGFVGSKGEEKDRAHVEAGTGREDMGAEEGTGKPEAEPAADTKPPGDDKESEDRRASTVAALEEAIKDAATVDQLTQVAQKVRKAALDPDSRSRLQEAISKRMTELMRDPQGEEIKKFVEIAIAELDFNPRSMKRYLNLVRLLRTVQVVRGTVESPDYDRKLVLRAAHLIVTWPQFVGWLQSPRIRYTSSAEVVNPVKSLEEVTKKSRGFTSWKKKIESQWSNCPELFPAEPGLYLFLKKISGDPPGLLEMTKTRLF